MTKALLEMKEDLTKKRNNNEIKKIITFYQGKKFIHFNWNNVFHFKRTWTFGNFGEVGKTKEGCKTQDGEGGEN